MPKLAIKEAGATLNGRLIAKCRVPRGTALGEAEIQHESDRVLFVFKVLWWAIPYYLWKAIYAMLQDGMSYHVFVDRIPNKGGATVELQGVKVVPQTIRQVH